MTDYKNFKNEKSFRLLDMYERLNKGEILYKSQLSEQYGVSEKSIQRDISDLRIYLVEHHENDDNELVYDKKLNGYKLEKNNNLWFNSKEVLAICKIILESRAFNKKELQQLIEKLLIQTPKNERKEVEEIIRKELFYYVPPLHNKNLFSRLWDLTQYINCKEIIEIEYTRKDDFTRNYLIKPVAIMFSEYYFYVISYMADDTKKDPTVFRVDRIKEIKNTHEHFVTPYQDEFNDGEFRKRVQFMFTGKLTKVKFEYSGYSLEAILDRIPTAKIVSQKDNVYTIEAEAYGEGIIMWLKTQGDYVKMIEK